MRGAGRFQPRPTYTGGFRPRPIYAGSVRTPRYPPSEPCPPCPVCPTCAQALPAGDSSPQPGDGAVSSGNSAMGGGAAPGRGMQPQARAPAENLNSKTPVSLSLPATASVQGNIMRLTMNSSRRRATVAAANGGRRGHKIVLYGL